MKYLINASENYDSTTPKSNPKDLVVGPIGRLLFNKKLKLAEIGLLVFFLDQFSITENFLFSCRELSNYLGVSFNTLKKLISNLDEKDLICVNPTSKGTSIKINKNILDLCRPVKIGDSEVSEKSKNNSLSCGEFVNEKKCTTKLDEFPAVLLARKLTNYNHVGLALLLRDLTSPSGGTISYRKLAKITGSAVTTIRRNFHSLETQGILQIIASGSFGVVFRFTPEIPYPFEMEN